MRLLTNRNCVGLQCWEVGLYECEITLCCPRDKRNAINRKVNILVYGRSEVNIVMLTYMKLTFECLYISAKKQN